MSEPLEPQLEALRAENALLREELTQLRSAHEHSQSKADIATIAFEKAPYLITFFDVVDEKTYFFISSNPASTKSTEVYVDDDGVLHSPEINPESLRLLGERLFACVQAGKPLEFEAHYQIRNRDLWTQSLYIPLEAKADGKHRVMVTAFDITERKLRENSEIAERELIIEQQTAMLAELSTPLLTLSDQVVVMPLIGALDSRRAQQVMDSLLTGVAETRASVVIMDITGVVVVDTQVANALLRAAQAVQLLGARVVITGIRPEIAQTMVGLGVDLAAITTRSTLQSAVSALIKV